MKIKILIVDDSLRARNSLYALLAIYAEDAEIQEAENGLDALERIDRSCPDLVLMDVLMPELDGIQATRRIKQKAPQIKVIAMSMSPDYRSETLAAGADAFVCKGDPPGVLLEALARLTGVQYDDSEKQPSAL